MNKYQSGSRFQNQDKKDFVRRNEQIRIPQVRVIHNGQNLGVMPTKNALAQAKELELDLVEVAPESRPPVCHIMDYGKFMFDRQKKAKVKSKAQQMKEVAFRYVIDENDLDTKINQIRGFIEKGDKVKCAVKFKNREKAHKDQGFELLNRVISKLADVADAEKQPTFEGANIILILDAKKAK